MVHSRCGRGLTRDGDVGRWNAFHMMRDNQSFRPGKAALFCSGALSSLSNVKQVNVELSSRLALCVLKSMITVILTNI